MLPGAVCASLAGRVGVAAGVVSSLRLPVGSLWEVQSPSPELIGLPTQRVFHGGAAGGSPHWRATWGDVQMSAGDLGRCARSSGNTRGPFSRGARPRLCPQVELGRERGFLRPQLSKVPTRGR